MCLLWQSPMEVASLKVANRLQELQDTKVRSWAVACFRDFFGGISNVTCHAKRGLMRFLQVYKKT